MGLFDAYFGLSANVNKLGDDYKDETIEGVVSSEVPELKLDIDDDKLIELKNQWIKDWEVFNVDLSRSQQDAENYWLGKQFTSRTAPDGHALVDNLIFESLETFLPIATRQKAEPVVESDGSPEGDVLARNTRKMLAKKADDMSLNLKMKQVARYWSLYRLGVMKIGWSFVKDDFVLTTIRPQKLILDPDATISECEYTGEYIGEYRKDTAKILTERFPKHKKYILDQVKGKLGTKMTYIEWWTDEYVFWTLKDLVLDKAKNPHWNYEEQPAQQIPEQLTGQPIEQPKRSYNHFKIPQKPYIPLSVFNLGMHPVDDTGLISQNLPLQDAINKRMRQIDNNADNFANSSVLVSGDSFTEEQATNVAIARQKGGAIFVPTGPVESSVRILEGAPIPNFIYESLVDSRNELRNIFGTRGSTPQGTISEQTVRGKLAIKGQDTDRAGGGVSVFLEQFADRVYNWMVQMIVVYYDVPHVAAVVGMERATEYISLSKADFTAELTISVKEGSMIPKDPVTQRNEAIDLWAAGAVDPITFFDRLEFPNPRESAKNLYLWQVDPIQLFPDLVQKQQEAMQAEQPQPEPPKTSMNFKDLPPDGQVQLAARAGIQITPETTQPAMAEQQTNKQRQADIINQMANQTYE